MPNTWNGMTFTNIAREGFSAFNQALAPLGVCSTDFSSEAVGQGTIVQTRIVPASDAAVDMSDAGNLNGSTAYDREDANIIKDISTTAVTVTLNQAPAAGFVLEDHTADALSAGVWEDTAKRLVRQKAYAVANFCVKAVINSAIAGTFTNTAVYTGAASAFDMDDVVDAGEACKQDGWDAGSTTYMVLDTAYAAALKKDNAIQDLSASGIGVVKDGLLTKLDMFNVLEVPVMRNCTTFYDATAYGRGFVCKPAAMAIAMRPIKSQAPDKLAWYEIMTDPESGVSLVYRAHYSARYGNMYHVFETFFGVAEAQVEALSLILSQ